MRVMRSAALALLLLMGLAVIPAAYSAHAAGEQPPGIAAQLRYIGRDSWTGRPEPIAERAIFEIEASFENYNEETREPVPPPPVTGLDVVSIAAPGIGLTAPVARYGLDRAGRLDVPQDAANVGWQPAYSSLPGAGGTTFFAAHYVFGSSAGVFFRLSALAPGELVAVTLSDGSVHTYRVTSNIDYALEAIDMGAILQGREGVESITLMTCSGPGDATGFPLRTVVLAERVS